VSEIKKIIDFSIKSSFWVATAVCALVGVTYENFEIPANNYFLIFVFFGTVFGYNFIKYFEKEQLHGIRYSEFKSIIVGILKKYSLLQTPAKYIFLWSVSGLLICFFCFLMLDLKTQCLLLIPLFLTICYAVSFGRKTLRNISGIKIYIVGITWALITVLFPIIEEGLLLTTDVWVTFLQRFLFVIILILPFEIRDLLIDDKLLRTLPQKYGVRNTKLYGLLLLMLFFFLEFFKDESLHVNLIVMPLVFLITLLLLALSSEKQSKYYSSFFVEGIPILWLILLLVL